MTGYGRAEKMVDDNLYIVEIRSLNGKQMDIRLNVSSYFRPLEMEIRNLIASQLVRGSVECVITLKNNGVAKQTTLNTALIKSYHATLKDLAAELQVKDDDLLSVILKLPDVVTTNTEQIKEEDWNDLKETIYNAMAMVVNHRKIEGAALEKDLLERVDTIEKLEELNAEVAPHRKEKIREQLTGLLEEHVGAEKVDKNRLEQELIYYIEKIDISEEQVRLRNHCDYFRNILKEPDINKGKKLSFLLQEFGREINTTGAKANDVQIQKNVVLMKDELEKAKEQVLNVL